MKIFLAFGISFFIAYLLTPYIRKLGIRTNILAYPNERSIHESPIPTMGGMSFFISFLFSFLLFGDIAYQKAFLIAAIVIFIVGLIDDSSDLRPIVKLLGQLLGTAIFFILYLFDKAPINLSISFIVLYGFLYFFILGVINAINLTDGLDGLAAGIFAISSIEFSFLLHDIPEVNLIIFSILGGVIGFLFFNFYPARIFMGDTGSNFLGFALGVFSFYTVVHYKFFPGVFYIFLILSLPILDTLFAIIRRYLRGQSIFKADKYHIHHLLLKLGYSQPKAVLLIWGISLLSFLPVILINKIHEASLQWIITGGYYIFLVWGIIYINKKFQGGGKNV